MKPLSSNLTSPQLAGDLGQDVPAPMIPILSEPSNPSRNPSLPSHRDPLQLRLLASPHVLVYFVLFGSFGLHLSHVTLDFGVALRGSFLWWPVLWLLECVSVGW